LQPFAGEPEGVIPLMAVVQANKNKVRPVMDYRELNQYVSSHTAESEVCGEKLRQWRKMGTNLKIMDLRKAYLQLHVSEELWKYQVVKFKGRLYCLTRLGFGLSVAPKIMCSIVHKVLSMNENVRAGTDSYVDDIIVNEDVVQCEKVKEVLNAYGLEVKEPESLVGGRVLGLRIMKEKESLWWRRDNLHEDIKSVQEMSKRDVFSLCGQLLGHFPVASWLRPACGFIKRTLNSQGWDERITNICAHMLEDVLNEIKKSDPVKGV
jgi:hypothetical protein